MKVYSSILVNDDDCISTSINNKHLLKQYLPISVTEEGILIFTSDEDSKACSSILVTDDGTSKCVNKQHSLKTYGGSDFKVEKFSNVTSDKDVHLLNAYF